MSEDAAVTHRVYDMEVIELSEEVSFLLLLPPVENVCSVPGHTEEITENPNYLTLPVQVFEMSKLIYVCGWVNLHFQISYVWRVTCKLIIISGR